MITSKYIDRIVIGLMAAAVIICLVFVGIGHVKDTSKTDAPAFAGSDAGTSTEYEQKLFDPDHPMTIDIIMDGDQWINMLKNASKKKWESCDVVVNGTRFYNVGIRTKGDSSLSSIAEDPNSNRYSFKLKFNKYTDSQKCWGLDKLCLNNNYGDITNMKDAMVYDMFRYLDADAPLYNYAKINLNGEYWGVYLALEAVDDSFLRRNYGKDAGALYKPGGNGGDEDGGGEELGDEAWPEDDMEMMEEAGEFADMGDLDWEGDDEFQQGMNEGGAELNYIDDKLDSYWGIWPCQINKTSKKDHRRVVKALKHVSAKKDLGSCIDLDNVLRYMAAHQFSVNNDSLSGDGAHNYYLYEKDGRLNLIPWDYNLCLGAYDMEDMGADAASDSGASGNASDGNDSPLPVTETATDMVNKPIDDPWARTSFFDGILEDPEYREIYHDNFQRLIDGYVLDGGFDLFYSRTRAQIDSLVKSDPNALYSYEAYDKAAKMLKQTVLLRGKSVKGQLDGSIPSTAEGQKKHPELLVDARSIDLKTMGGDSVDENMEDWTGEGFEGDRSEEDWEKEWQTVMNQFLQKQKETRQKTIRHNVLLYSACFLMAIAACVIALVYRRRRM